MRAALAAAAAHRTHPNPRVGAVIVGPDGAQLAIGAHPGAGHTHAEVLALESLGGPPPPGSTLVVTLEPCNHHGRTPPCTDAIIASGLRRVVVGALDPDPRVSGRGIARLEETGIEVISSTAPDEVETIDPAYFHHRRTGRARLLVKTAMTLDGQTAAADGTSQWITSPEARADAHSLRAESDAVMVGAGTVRADDPLLTVRSPDFDGSQPVPVVISGKSPLPSSARLWERAETLVYSTSPTTAGPDPVIAPADPDGYPDLGWVAADLGERGLLSVLVEGGSRLLGALWAAALVDAGVTYLGARLAGGVGLPVFAGTWRTVEDALPITIGRVAEIGPDVRVDWVFGPRGRVD